MNIPAYLPDFDWLPDLRSLPETVQVAFDGLFAAPIDAVPGFWLALSLVVVLLVAECLVRWAALPRVSSYVGAGMLLGPAGLAIVGDLQDIPWRTLIELGLGLLMFELGCRVNLRWLFGNPWLSALSLVEAATSFAAVFAFVVWLGTAPLEAAAVAAIAMVAAPSLLVRMVVETRAQGQVADRVLLLSALSCLYAVIATQLVIPLATAGPTTAALPDWLPPVFAALVSLAVGVAFGVALTLLHRSFGQREESFALLLVGSIALATLAAASLKLNPVLLLLAAGLAMRHRHPWPKIFPPHFGSAGAVLVVLMFGASGLALDVHALRDATLLVVGLIGVRSLAKLLAVLALAIPSGISWRQGLALGSSLAPMCSFALVLTLDAAAASPGFADHWGAVLLSAIAVLGLAGPVMLRLTLGSGTVAARS